VTDKLFTGPGRNADTERAAMMRRIAAFVSPVAADAGAVVDDVEVLDLADAIWAAFGDLDAHGGLSRADLAGACQDVCADQAWFDSRFDLWVTLGLLMPVRDKTHQQRYVFNPTGAAALMVFERLGTDGGVQEIVTLLDTTSKGLKSGTATPEQLRAALVRIRRAFSVYADHLHRLVDVCPLEELLAERRHHRVGESLLSDARDLIHLVVERFPDLALLGDRLIDEAVRYSEAVQRFIARLLEEVSERRDFSMLDAEQYLTAALTRSRDQLAEVFARVVFDRGNCAVDAASTVSALDALRVRPPRRRPPRPADPVTSDDPVERARQRAEQVRQRRVRATELHLDGEVFADVTRTLRQAGWPRAAQIVAELLAVHLDPALPYRVDLSTALLVDAEGDVSYVAPMTVHRVDGRICADLAQLASLGAVTADELMSALTSAGTNSDQRVW
jgi:hypothetical protein